MSAKLTAEQHAAIHSREQGQPLRVQDDQGKNYFLIAAEDVPHLWSDYLHSEVAKGLADIEAGNVVSWDPDKMKRLARNAAATSGSP